MFRTAFYKTISWFTVISGLILPFLFSLRHFPYYLQEPDQLLLKLIGAVYCDIPFMMIACMTMKDSKRSIPLAHGRRIWLFRYFPPMVVYVLMLANIAYASYTGRQGASTAPILLIFFPFVGVGLVLMVNAMNPESSDLK